MLNCTESHAENAPDLNEHSTFCEEAASLDNGLSYSTVKKLPPLQEAEHRRLLKHNLQQTQTSSRSSNMSC